MRTPSKSPLAITTLAVLLFWGCHAHAQVLSNSIFGNVADYGLAQQKNVTVTATLLSPNPRQVGNIQVRQDPVSTRTDSNGAYAFTNFQWGKYSLLVSGQYGTTFTFYVGTNTVGQVPIGSLITNSAALPPNDATNYYTRAQVDALLSLDQIALESGRTNLLWGTNLTVRADARPLAAYYVYSNGVPQYATLSTNFP